MPIIAIMKGAHNFDFLLSHVDPKKSINLILNLKRFFGDVYSVTSRHSLFIDWAATAELLCSKYPTSHSLAVAVLILSLCFTNGCRCAGRFYGPCHAVQAGGRLFLVLTYFTLRAAIISTVLSQERYSGNPSLFLFYLCRVSTACPQDFTVFRLLTRGPAALFVFTLQLRSIV